MFPKIVGFTPKSSIQIGFSIINPPFWGKTLYFGNTHTKYVKLKAIAFRKCLISCIMNRLNLFFGGEGKGKAFEIAAWIICTNTMGPEPMVLDEVITPLYVAL